MELVISFKFLITFKNFDKAFTIKMLGSIKIVKEYDLKHHIKTIHTHTYRLTQISK